MYLSFAVLSISSPFGIAVESPGQYIVFWLDTKLRAEVWDWEHLIAGGHNSVRANDWMEEDLYFPLAKAART